MPTLSEVDSLLFARTGQQTDTVRRIVFISHANPEDNEFAEWLSLRLAREGYAVWCDLTKLLGGYDFWLDIDDVLRDKAAKFVYILSRTSNVKDGPLRELSLAGTMKKKLGLRNFVIPVKVDDIRHSEHTIELHRLNALDFSTSWATGLAALLRTLEEEDVPKDPHFSPKAVASWWNEHRLNQQIVSSEPETLLSNWFPLGDLPAGVWIWPIPQRGIVPDKAQWPAYRVGHTYISFANARELTGTKLSPTGSTGTQFITADVLRNPPRQTGLTSRQVRIAIRQILIQAWIKFIESKGLPIFEMANKRKTLFFPGGFTEKDRVSFRDSTGKAISRSLVGYSTKKHADGSSFKRYWHFGLEAQPVLYPQLAVALKAHVIFTHDRITPIGSAASQHKARRSQCKDWWNDKWRDSLLASVHWLEADTGSLLLPLSPSCSVCMSNYPVPFSCPRSYDDGDVRAEPIADEDDDRQVDIDHGEKDE